MNNNTNLANKIWTEERREKITHSKTEQRAKKKIYRNTLQRQQQMQQEQQDTVCQKHGRYFYVDIKP